jgi:hypothetical protein
MLGSSPCSEEGTHMTSNESLEKAEVGRQGMGQGGAGIRSV